MFLWTKHFKRVLSDGKVKKEFLNQSFNLNPLFGLIKVVLIYAKVLTKIVNKGEDVNAVLSNGEPPVCEAVKNASKDVLSVLIKGKAGDDTVIIENNRLETVEKNVRLTTLVLYVIYLNALLYRILRLMIYYSQSI